MDRMTNIQHLICHSATTENGMDSMVYNANLVGSTYLLVGLAGIWR